MGLNKILIRRAPKGHFYVCNACHQDLDEHFKEKRRHGNT
jgi:uncharacterized CHY-type Zn-finger protein